MASRIDVSIEHKQPPPETDGKRHPNTCPKCQSHYRDDELEARALGLLALRSSLPDARAASGSRTSPTRAPSRRRPPSCAPRTRSRFFDIRPYTERLAEAEVATGLGDAMVIGQATLDEHPVELAVMDFAFMGGSMGSVVGEKFSRACDSAAERGAPLDLGLGLGRRPHAGGDPRADAAAEDGLRGRGPARGRPAADLSVLAHPTTGGLLASFASLGDVVLAEPGALMSFAGPRVVQQTTREKLPDDFGLAESNLRYGHVDAVVPRAELRAAPVPAPPPLRWPVRPSSGCASGSAS